MSDAKSDQKTNDMQVRKDRHPGHFPSPDIGAKEDFRSVLHDVMTAKEPTAVKHDTGKTEYHHMPPDALEEVNKVLTFGAKKYAAYGYRGGFSYSRLFNAAMRHLWAYWNGEDRDKESSLSHLAHAACCILFMLQQVIDKRGTDDRYKG